MKTIPRRGDRTSMGCSLFLFFGILEPTVTRLKIFLCRKEKDIGASLHSFAKKSLQQGWKQIGWMDTFPRGGKANETNDRTEIARYGNYRRGILSRPSDSNLLHPDFLPGIHPQPN